MDRSTYGMTIVTVFPRLCTEVVDCDRWFKFHESLLNVSVFLNWQYEKQSNKMQGVTANFGNVNFATKLETESFKIDNNFYGAGSHYLSSGPFGSNNTLLGSGPTSLPSFTTGQEESLSTWYGIGRKNSFSHFKEGPSSLTTFDHTLKIEKGSPDSSKNHSLGSQEWNDLIEDVILNEIAALRDMD